MHFYPITWTSVGADLSAIRGHFYIQTILWNCIIALDETNLKDRGIS
jgi:hypothetical protein